MIEARLLGAVLAGAVPGALLAQTAATAPAATVAAAPRKAGPRPAEPDDEESTIVVTGQRQPGAVIGDIPPEVQIGPAEIRSYGVSTVTDLLAELTPQTGSGSGRGGEAPVVLLNGRRISSLAEIRDIPTEAIQRVDILPEEVALKYGYSADQKVVNFVLRRRFRAVTAEGQAGTSTEGGGASGRGELDMLRINGDGRLNLDVSYTNGAALRESQRDISGSAPGQPFAFGGNVAAPPGSAGTEIDPALSALAGRTVTVAGLPAGLEGRPTLAGFVAGANAANVSDLTRYRTLRPATDQLSVNAVLNRTVLGNVSATLNGTFGATGSDALRGLGGATVLVPASDPFSPFGSSVAVYRYPQGLVPLTQRIAGETAHLGLTLNGDVAKWRWSLTANYDHSDTRTTTAGGLDLSAIQAQIDAGSTTLNPFAPLPLLQVGLRAADRAHALANSGNVQLVANGSPFALPAGDVSTTLKLGGDLSAFDTSSLRSGFARSASLSRRDVNGQINVDVPLTSRRRAFLGAIGDLSANFNAAAERLSDFGTLRTLGYGLTWKPRDRLSLIWSVTNDDGAPTVQQLGNPQISTPAVPLFDYVRGQAVDVTQIGGGNPALLHDNRRVTKLGLTWKPLEKTDLSITANYIRSSIRNAIATLPSPTAAIEAAFPDRFVRDADGALLSIDSRPVNFAREERRQLRWGINFSRPLKTSQKLIDAFRAARARGEGGPGRPDTSSPPAGAIPGAVAGALTDARNATPNAAARDPGPRDGNGGGGFGGGGRGGGGRFGGGQGGGRLQFAVYHTWLLRDDISIREGVPVLDLLNGAASGAAGGQPRHQVEAQAGVTNNGLGARLSATWQSGTVVRGGGGAASQDLFFSDLATANLRLFANLGGLPSLVGKSWARGARITLSVNNLFDTRLRVRDATGVTPLSYQPAYLDPVGREVRLSIRKLFF